MERHSCFMLVSGSCEASFCWRLVHAATAVLHAEALARCIVLPLFRAHRSAVLTCKVPAA